MTTSAQCSYRHLPHRCGLVRYEVYGDVTQRWFPACDKIVPTLGRLAIVRQVETT